MNLSLTIDQGNSSAKVSVFSGTTLLQSHRFERLAPGDLDLVMAGHAVTAAIYSSVVGNDSQIEELLSAKGVRTYMLDERLPMPLAIDYATPSTLGHDRIAAAVGALTLVPGRDCLVVDAGTAVTYDYVTADAHFKGGNIAPGLSLRFQALASHCVQLPRVDVGGDIPTVGYDTPTAIRSGVVLGLVAEIEMLARRLGSPAIVLTGGDSPLVADRISDSVIVDNDLVAKGLNRILEYNEIL